MKYSFFSNRLSHSTNRTEAFKQRVEADGGQIADLAAVDEAYGKLSEWGVTTSIAHWSSPRFGYKLNAAGRVTKRYCLFNNDALADTETGWRLLANTTGKPQQMEVATEEFTSRMVVPALVWPDKKLTASIIASSYKDYYADGHYGFFPLVELSANWNNTTGFLLGNEPHNGGHIEGGFSYPYNLRTSSVPISPGILPYALRITIEPIDGVYVRLAQGPNQYFNDRYGFGNPQPTGGYSSLPIFIGGRGDGTDYRWLGTINDVFLVNALLDDTAIAWLDALSTKY